MNRKDIALTVAGVLATMALAYLFYRQQQQTAAVQAATTSQDVTSPDYSNDAALYDQSMAYQYASQLASVSVPTVSSTSSTSSLTGSVDTSASTAATGNQPDTEYSDLFAQILANFHGANSNDTNSVDYSALVIPTLNTQPAVSTTGIPTTAAAAASQADSMLGINTSGLTSAATNAVPAPSTQAPATTSTNATDTYPIHFNHILNLPSASQLSN
jgi:hypothetical protein